MLNKGRGFLISFEGIDGSGKSTQIENIKKYFINSPRKFIFTREPGGTEESELIRKHILNDNKNINFEKKTELLLLLAARHEHFKKLIEPAILNGTVVICDRFIDSTLAYQCGEHEELINFYYSISKQLISNFAPNLTILLDISPSQALKRINNRVSKDKYDNKDIEFFSKVRKSYSKIAKNNNRIITLNANEKEDILTLKIKKLICDVIN